MPRGVDRDGAVCYFDTKRGKGGAEMKRIYAAGVLAILTVLVAALTCLAPKAGALTGSWEIEVDLGETPVVLRYTFCDDGTYTCAIAPDRSSLDDGAQLRGNYLVRGERLYLSEGLDYEIDLGVYDRFHLEGDELTLLENSANQMTGFYPLALTRVPEG